VLDAAPVRRLHAVPDAAGASLFLGRSPAAAAVRQAIEQAARVECPVLILGETGVGKEIVAREIHRRSRRARGPFVAMNCAAIPDTLVESELFGYLAGAFTDARAPRRGAFETADGGTLLLDEVSELSRAAQPKLLRAIELGEVRALGGEKVRRVDNRIVASTNQDLLARCRAGAFRSDLYFRLDVLEIRIPPLRTRPEDVPVLAEHFVEAIARGNGRPCPAIRSAALARLQAHDWPGNVRELRAVLERSMACHPEQDLDGSSILVQADARPVPDLALLYRGDWRSARRGFETLFVEALLGRHGHDLTRAAQAARISKRGLYKILRRIRTAPRS
jgi:DNA-binding NtrC family response regulator